MINQEQLGNLNSLITEIDKAFTLYLEEEDIRIMNTKTNKQICVISTNYWGIIQYYDVKQCNNKPEILFKKLINFMIAVKGKLGDVK